MAADGTNVLLVVSGAVSPRLVAQRLSEHVPSAARVYVVAPTLVAPLDWLATAEDDARREAEVRALEIEWVLADALDVGGGAGEADPVQAVEDALRRFPADEIVIAGDRADPDLDRALTRFRLPVARLTPAPGARSRGSRALRGLAAGRGELTPFVLFVGVNGALLLLAVVLSLVVAVILWLSGNL